MRKQIWQVLKQSLSSFVADEALTRGAAIAFYTVTSIAPLLLIVISIAGIVFGQEAARGAVTAQFAGLMGEPVAKTLETAIANASDSSAGTLAALIGVATLVFTASGAFGEMQSALNVIWKSQPGTTSVSRLLRARAASLGLVATLGFLLVVSLAVSAAITAFSERLDRAIPLGSEFAALANFTISFVLITAMFAAVYKVLPDRPLRFRDVMLGAGLSALLFVMGKSLIGWYIGSSGIASTYGAAGTLIVLLLWVYYSVQTFLLGAVLAKTLSGAGRRKG